MKILKIVPILLAIFSLSVFAQNAGDIQINAEIEIPNIYVGEQVIYRVTISGSSLPQQISPDVPGIKADGIDVIDVNSSRSMIAGSSMTIVINGQVVRDDKSGKEEVSYEYVIRAKKEGTYNLGPAVVTIDGVEYRSPQVTFRVNDSPTPAAAAPPPNADVFLQAVPSKTSVYAGQIITVGYYLYYNDNAGIKKLTSSEKPELKGFIQHDFEIPNTARSSLVTLENGREYYRVFIGRLIVIPTRTGNLEIGAYKQGYLIQKVYPSRSVFPDVRNTEEFAASEAIPIEVKDFPVENKPGDFSGAVGNFTIDADIDKTEVRAGESVTVNIKLTGVGNLQGVTDPKLPFPQSFQSYPPEKQEQSDIERDEMRSTRTYKYILSPDEVGEFTLGPVTFSYFDPATGSFSTISTKAFKLNVLEGRIAPPSFSGTDQRAQNLQSDIRYIKPDAQSLSGGTAIFYKRAWFIGIHFLPIFGIFASVLYRTRRDKLQTDTAYARKIKSKDAALKRLNDAKANMGKSKDDFYRDLFSAVCGFISDNFNMPKAGLSPQDIGQSLKAAGTQNDVVDRAVKFLENCQAARYSPAFGQADEQQILKEAQDIIEILRKAIKDAGGK